MKNYDGDIIYKEVEGKIKDTIELAKEVDDEKNQYFIIAGVLTSRDKFIDEEYANMVRSWLKMTKVEKIIRYTKLSIEEVRKLKEVMEL